MINTQEPVFNSNLLEDLVNFKMPFGKYKGTLICNLPESYLVWFNQKGWPEGKLGLLLATMYEIQLNGLEYLLNPLKNTKRKSS
ncbi:MAG: DUF3820 family protein [Bacteroidales bacterium]